jgi:rhodanese-related sulfurtransferase
VVIFPDNIFKYASSVARHFPQFAPPSANGDAATAGTSKNDQFLAELIENLKNPYDTVKVKDLSDELQSAEKPLLVDIRIPEHFHESHIPGAINIPQVELGVRATELPDDRNAPIVTVCNIGKFSKYASLYLKSKGYRNVRSAKGGLDEWVRKGLPTTSEKAAASATK